jgi:integrase
VRARTRRRLPVVLSQEEVRAVLQRLHGAEALVAGLLYGSGLRLMEALRLRVHDLEFGRHELTVRDGKGGKDRRTLLPVGVASQLRSHLLEVRTIHKRDLVEGWGRVQLPHALARKYPNAPVESISAPGSVGCWDQQTGHLQYLSAFLCHPRAESRPPRRRQPRRPAVRL